jgi:hypothetical protein
MFPAVLDAWRRFSEPLEGRVAGMYLDVRGLVTCAVGCLIEPVSAALELPWHRDSDGQRATPDEVRAAWLLLKARQEYAHRSVAAARALTGLHLTEDDIDALVARRLGADEAFLVANHFPKFSAFPADAQFGILSMAWAAGPGFPVKFPAFSRAVLAGDWITARDECALRETGNPGVVPRNIANRVCFANAEIVERCSLDRSVLNWPHVAQSELHPTERAANTETLVVAALDDARMHALEVSRLEKDRGSVT